MTRLMPRHPLVRATNAAAFLALRLLIWLVPTAPGDVARVAAEGRRLR